MNKRTGGNITETTEGRYGTYVRRAPFVYGSLGLSVQASYFHYSSCGADAFGDRYEVFPLEAYDEVEVAVIDMLEHAQGVSCILNKGTLHELGMAEDLLELFDDCGIAGYVPANVVARLHKEVRQMAEVHDILAREAEGK